MDEQTQQQNDLIFTTRGALLGLAAYFILGLIIAAVFV